jgi:hypothetical protein
MLHCMLASSMYYLSRTKHAVYRERLIFGDSGFPRASKTIQTVKKSDEAAFLVRENRMIMQLCIFHAYHAQNASVPNKPLN